MTEVPEAYEIGWVPFYGARIFLDSRPLIPRPETEYWLERALNEIRGRAGLCCLDLFAGSGAIGVAVLRTLPDSRVDFGEKYPRHFPTIQKNIRENDIDASRTRSIETDVFSKVHGRYDAIFANPPYLSKSRMARVQDSVLEHEPPDALFADDDGFALIGQTIVGLRDHLLPGGMAWIEHEPEHESRIMRTAADAGLLAEVQSDQFGVARYSRLRAMA